MSILAITQHHSETLFLSSRTAVLREKTNKINPVESSSQHERQTRCLSNPDGGLLGADSVIVVGRVSLTIFGAGGGVVTHLNGLEVGGVGGGEGGLVLSTDSLEDSVGGGDGGVLLILVLGSREGSRVEQDEGVLFGSDGGEVTGGNGTLQVNDSATVGVSCSLDGSFADGSIGEGSHRHGGSTGGGNNSSHGHTAVHAQGSGGTLSAEKEIRNKKQINKLLSDRDVECVECNQFVCAIGTRPFGFM